MSFSENNGPAEAVIARASAERSANLILKVSNRHLESVCVRSSIITMWDVLNVDMFSLGLPNGDGQST